MAGRPAEKIGVEAQFLIAEFVRNQTKYNAALARATGATQSFADKTAQSSQKADKAVNQSTKKMIVSWGAASVAAVAFGAAASKAFEKVEEAARARGMREAFISLGAFYGVDTGKLVADLKRISDGTLSTAAAIEVASSAMLAGGKAFATDLPRLFEIARAAAVATGKDVDWVFSTLIDGIARGSPLLIDNAKIYLSLGDALEEYAASLGKTVGELTRQERTQATLNATLREGGVIIEAVGEEALRATVATERWTAAAEDFEAAMLAVGTAGEGTSGVIGALTRGLEALTPILVRITANMAGVWALLTVNPWEVLSGDVGLFDAYLRAVNTTLGEGTKALGDFASTATDAAPVIEAALKPKDVDLRAATLKRQEYFQKLTDMQVEYTGKLVAAELAASHKLEDTATSRARRIEDIERASALRRGAIWQSYNQRIARLDVQNYKQSQQAAVDHGKRMADIERAYQERIADIERAYQETMYDAIAARDATAALRAIRQRKADLADAASDRNKQQSDAAADYRDQVLALKDALAEQRQAAKDERDQQLRDLDANLTEQMDALERSLKRQQEDMDKHNLRQLIAMQLRYNADYSAATAAYKNQENLYAQHLLNMAALWNQFTAGTAGGGGTKGGSTGGYRWAEGGAMIATQPTTITVGEGRHPELVVATPLTSVPQLSPSKVSVTHGHDISGSISAEMRGMEGRMTAVLRDAIFREIGKAFR